MRGLFWPLLVALSALKIASALHESDVGVVDWHKRLIGPANTLAPATLPQFQRVRNETTQTTSSVVLTGTRSNVFAAMDPMNGTILWRHVQSSEDILLSFATHSTQGLVATQSGPGGANIRLYTSLKGILVCDNQLHELVHGILQEPAWLGSAITFDSNSRDMYVLTNGNTVTKLDENCEAVWTWSTPVESYSTISINIMQSTAAIYVVGMTASTASYTMHIFSLDPKDGSLIESKPIHSSVTNPNEFLLLRSTPEPSKGYSLIWHEKSKLHYILLDPTVGSVKPSTVAGSYSKIFSLGNSVDGYFVAESKDHTSHLLRFTSDAGVKNIWEFAGSKDDPYTPTSSRSLYSAGYDKVGKVYVSRTYWSFSLGMGNMAVWSEGMDGRGMLTGLSFPFEPYSNGIMQHVALDVSHPNPMTVLPRYVISTTLGTYQLWHYDKLQWTKEEGLAEVADHGVQLVELPEEKNDMDVVNQDFVHRLRRQLIDAQNLPRYIFGFARRFITGEYNSPAPIKAKNGTTIALQLYRDTFGFRKAILVASEVGKVYALDSSTGDIIYTRTLSFGGIQAASFKIVKLFLTRSVSDAPNLQPQAVLVAMRITPAGGYTTMFYRWEALTGKSFAPGESELLLEGHEMFHGATQDAYLVDTTAGKTLVVIDDSDKVHLHPNDQSSQDAFYSLRDKLHFPLIDFRSIDRRLVGHRLSRTSNSLSTTWSRSPPPGHSVQLTFRPPPQEPIASFGKVLGNRTTLYKYINRNIIGFVSSSPSIGKTESIDPRCSLHLVDGVTGNLIYQVNIPVAPEAACDVKATLTENWLVYQYWEPDSVSAGSAKGWRVVSVELYEGNRPDDRYKSSERSSYSLAAVPVTIYEQSFVFPRAITALTTTKTANGITVKDLVVASANGHIQTLARRFLDPRRPKSKPNSKEMEQEWLIQYDPLLPDDPHRILSHRYDVANIRRIHTSPTNLESTTLVFAHGLDLLFSRTSPSGTFDLLSESFNKAQLIMTILGLTTAIAITRPMVKRKRLRERWYY